MSTTSDECLKIHKVTRAELDALSPNTPAEGIHNNIKCYAKCLLRDYIGPDNKLDLKRVGDRANAREKVIMERCIEKYDSISESSPCDYGYLILQCLTLRTESTGTVEEARLQNPH
ncbi:hypothetical protein KR222_007555 [Zaprionus bogoriensis]|nr:hypothetical protein KR222_007555 [Zaprionus bogoriensis]